MGPFLESGQAFFVCRCHDGMLIWEVRRADLRRVCDLIGWPIILPMPGKVRSIVKMSNLKYLKYLRYLSSACTAAASKAFDWLNDGLGAML